MGPHAGGVQGRHRAGEGLCRCGRAVLDRPRLRRSTLHDDPATVIRLFVDEINGTRLGPFTYGIDDRRGRYAIIYQSELGPDPTGLARVEDRRRTATVACANPPFVVDVPIHGRYGGPLPVLPVVVLAENVAEKIARLNRRSPARDAYDLVWVARTPGLDLDRSLIRRLAVLKAWVDLHGLHTDHAGWSAPLPNARPFDVDRWLTPRGAHDFDDEAIGLPTVPPPDLGDLGRDLSLLYAWLGDLGDDERAVAEGRPQDRSLVLRLLGQLPGGRLSGVAR